MQECRRYPTIVGKQQPNPLNLRDPRTTPKLLQTITAKTERIVEFKSKVWFPSTSTNVPSPLKKGGRRNRKNSRLKGVQNRVQPPPIRRAHISPERRERGREEKNLRDKEGRAARTSEKIAKLRGRGGFVHKRKSIRQRGWTTGEWRSATLGAFRGDRKGGGPYETFQWEPRHNGSVVYIY